jgi:hypothetical protein
MSERVFRLILGSSLILLLFLQNETLIYCYIGLLLFEGITNWRIPVIISRLRYGEFHDVTSSGDSQCRSIPFDAERALRFVVAILLIVTYVLFPEQVWFFPWFIGFMLFMAGLTNICPMVMSLRWLGLR